MGSRGNLFGLHCYPLGVSNTCKGPNCIPAMAIPGKGLPFNRIRISLRIESFCRRLRRGFMSRFCAYNYTVL